MDAGRCLNLLSSWLGFFGAVFTAFGVWDMSPEVLAKISRTYFDYNEHLVENLASQKANYVVGLGLIAFAFVGSLSSFCPSIVSWINKRRSKAWRSRITVSVISILFGLGAYILNGYLCQIFKEEIGLNLHSPYET